MMRWSEGIPETSLCNLGMKCACPDNFKTLFNPGFMAEYLYINIWSNHKAVGDSSD